MEPELQPETVEQQVYRRVTKLRETFPHLRFQFTKMRPGETGSYPVYTGFLVAPYVVMETRAMYDIREPVTLTKAEMNSADRDRIFHQKVQEATLVLLDQIESGSMGSDVVWGTLKDIQPGEPS